MGMEKYILTNILISENKHHQPTTHQPTTHLWHQPPLTFDMGSLEIDPDYWKKLEEFRNEDKLVDFYNKHAHSYESTALPTAFLGVHKNCATLLKKRVPVGDGAKILDVACGTGLSGEVLKDYGYTNIDGIDPSESMLAICKTKPDIYKDIHLGIIDDTTNLPFGANSYDVVNCMSAISRNSLEIQNAMREFCRVVKPNGYAVLSIFRTIPPAEFLGVITEYVASGAVELLHLEQRVYARMDEEDHLCHICLLRILKRPSVIWNV